MRIAEIYRSVQGEGFLTGTESSFVRASGCNLRCSYCDTPYASWEPEGEDLAVEAILARLDEIDCRHVVITGGEPMLFAELIPLADGLRARGRHITIETAGTLYLPLACDLMSISPKLANSTPDNSAGRGWTSRHERSRHVPEVIRRLVQEYPYQLKFVVGNIADCEEVERYLGDFPQIDRQRVMLMPMGIERGELERAARWLEPYCREAGLHYCPRKHIEWFGLVRAT
ncbi:MAG TPA: 7-carboxy-7-deazaguanine synthase QueE [Pirellulales bacterium]|nr:7-carboxy-7-deazaguanine synthase QueE [Pirellulales bacterium]